MRVEEMRVEEMRVVENVSVGDVGLRRCRGLEMRVSAPLGGARSQATSRGC